MSIELEHNTIFTVKGEVFDISEHPVPAITGADLDAIDRAPEEEIIDICRGYAELYLEHDRPSKVIEWLHLWFYAHNGYLYN